ncbi:MAG: PhoH family protein [Synergistaceae bacterium]|nr:PhoH family protein [Synergistaceae bacterium]
MDKARQVHISADSEETLSRLLGPGDENLKLIERLLDVRISARGLDLSVSGQEPGPVEKAGKLVIQLLEVCRKGHPVGSSEIRYAAEAIGERTDFNLASLYEDVICLTTRGKPVRARTEGQRAYLEAMKKNELVFAIGPAGTGKTYLAVAHAVAALKAGRFNRIILVRPAVEAGEKLGFLPGDLMEKVEPYLRPLYDAFFDLLQPDRFLRYIDKSVIEIAPLAYMRGRTLNESCIILDEAQNTTPEQMKMFLTRMGFGSQVIVTGDITQVDLPSGKESGLKVVEQVLGGIPGIAFIRFGHGDVVRHELVQRIVRAYESYEQGRQV